MVHIAAHRPLVRVRQSAVGGELVQPQLEHPPVPAAPQQLDNGGEAQAAAVLLLHPGHCGENLLGRDGDVPLHKGAPAVAAAAALGRPGLPEVVQQPPPQASVGFAVAHHLLQPLHVPAEDLPPGLLLLAALGGADEVLGRLHVAGGEKEDALRRRAVPARPARLLVVALQIFGHVIVDDEADIGLVDAHTKGVGSHHDSGPVVDEVLLVLPPLLVLQPRVVAGGGHPLGAQIPAHRLHRFAGGAVDDAALVPPGAEVVRQPGGLALGADHIEKEVGPVEARGDAQGILQPQKAADVLPHRAGGGGGKGPHRWPPGQAGDKLGDAQVAGPEVLTPLGHAVGLVHRRQGDVHRGAQAEKALGHKPLRGHVENLVGPRPGPAEHLPVLLRRQGGVDERRRNARLLQRGHLVLHQGDQRRDHQGHPRQQQRRQLIAHGLPRPRGHDSQHVPAGQQGVHQLLLTGAEAAVAEVLFECRQFLQCGPPSGRGRPAACFLHYTAFPPAPQSAN